MSEPLAVTVGGERHVIQAPASDAERDFLEHSRVEDTYLLNKAGRVIWIPRGSQGQYGDLLPDDGACSVFGYEGNADVDAWDPTQPPFRADAARWFTVADLLTAQRLAQQEAQAADPKLLAFLAALESRPASVSRVDRNHGDDA